MDVALILAGQSFVGRHLREQLTRRGVTCLATARRAEATDIPCDVCKPGETDALLAAIRPRWIFACAGATADRSAAELHDVHVAATESLLRAVAHHVPNAVTVLLGSAAEYGAVAPECLPIREDQHTQPQSDYGRSKLAQTKLAQQLAPDHGLRVLVVRPFNLIGRGLGRQYFAAALCERLRHALRAERHGAIAIDNGSATRDWVDGGDAADALLRLALDAPPARGAAALYNIATGQETSVLEVARYLCGLAGDFLAVDAGRAVSRSGIDRSCGDATRLRSATGWGATTSWQRSALQLWESGFQAAR
jgi:GDP-4-dehydro-6-deoxy-D-mannose reductase